MAGKSFYAIFFTPALLFSGLGWSPGSRSQANFDWARNFKKAKLPDDENIRHRIRSSAALALFWNLTRSFSPPEVVKDFEDFVRDSGINTMDPGLEVDPKKVSKPTSQYSVPVNGHEVIFDNAHLAPPQGGFARNYGK